MKLMISGGNRCRFMLWIRRSVTAFGNAPSMSRKSADMTCPCLHAWRMVFSRRCNESSIERPGLPPKWVFGRRLCDLSMNDVRSVTMADSSFMVVFSRAIGW